MSRKLILGSVSRTRLVDLAPVAIVNGRAIFPLRGAEDDNEDGKNEQDESEEDDANEDDEDSSGEATKDDEDKNRRRGRRGAHNRSGADMRTELRELRKFRRETEAAAKAQELKDKPEIERLTVERDDAVKQLDDLRGKYSSAQTQLAIITASHGRYNWADIEDVLNDKTLRNSIEIDDDGEVSGVSDALKDLAKRKPHFLKSEDGKDSGKQNSGGSKNSNGANGNGKSGGQPGGGGNGDRSADREALAQKYPALNRLPQ